VFPEFGVTLPKDLKKQLGNAVVTTPLPIVLRQKSQPIGGNWTVPDTADKNVESYSYLYDPERIGYFEKFLGENNYTIVWENDLFVIYIPINR
jgi:hypothetical protein